MIKDLEEHKEIASREIAKGTLREGYKELIREFEYFKKERDLEIQKAVSEALEAQYKEVMHLLAKIVKDKFELDVNLKKENKK